MEATANVKHEQKDVYFVWTKTGRRPTRAHNTADEAIAEATRLASICPDRKFIVMHAFAKISAEAA